jgi:hypothetical protein
MLAARPRFKIGERRVCCGQLVNGHIELIRPRGSHADSFVDQQKGPSRALFLSSNSSFLKFGLLAPMAAAICTLDPTARLTRKTIGAHSTLIISSVITEWRIGNRGSCPNRDSRHAGRHTSGGSDGTAITIITVGISVDGLRQGRRGGYGHQQCSGCKFVS